MKTSSEAAWFSSVMNFLAKAADATSADKRALDPPGHGRPVPRGVLDQLDRLAGRRGWCRGRRRGLVPQLSKALPSDALDQHGHEVPDGAA